jgi:hypothetical protein
MKNPLAGGAEVMNEEIAKRLVYADHSVTFLVSKYKNCLETEKINGYKIIRVGGRITTYFYAYKYYIKYLKNWPDLIIEEMNTIPYMTQLYAGKTRRLIFVYQLCREIWFHQMFFPINISNYSGGCRLCFGAKSA